MSVFIQAHRFPAYWKGMRMQRPLEQANSFIWQVRLGQFWSSSAALTQSFSPSHTKLKGTQRGWPGYQVGQVNWLELQVRWPAGNEEGMRQIYVTQIVKPCDKDIAKNDRQKSKCYLTTLQFRSLIAVVPAVIVAVTDHCLRDAVSIGTCELAWIACFNLILCARTEKVITKTHYTTYS